MLHFLKESMEIHSNPPTIYSGFNNEFAIVIMKSLLIAFI